LKVVISKAQAKFLLIAGSIPFAVMLSVIIYNIDYSDENFKRYHYLQKLDNIDEMKIFCKAFDGKYISGEIIRIKTGRTNIITVQMDQSSDLYTLNDNSVLFENYYIKIQNNIITFNYSAGTISKYAISKGAHFYKKKDSKYFVISNGKHYSKIKFYYPYEDEYKSCKDLDTMNIIWNYNQYAKYDSLSRRHRSLKAKTKKKIQDAFQKQ